NGRNYGRSHMTTRQPLSRRGLLAGAGIIGAAAFASHRAAAQRQPARHAQLGTHAGTITSPPRDWTPGRPSIYPDPDVIVIDPAFNSVRLGSAPIRRLWTGANWSEGPAWSSQGQYLVFSDVTGSVQYRYVWEDGRVTAFCRLSANAHGKLNPRIGAPNAGALGGKKRELSTNVYRWDPSGKLDVVITEEQLPDPNGLCFAPDHKTLYVISTGRGPGDVGPGGQRVVY